ncbi:MAG: hypothetical protein AAGK92_09275 [Pseudomonadota bacterium]
MKRTCIIVLSLLPVLALAEDKRFTLDVDPVLVEAGLMQHLLPRFSLKTGIKVNIDASEADLVLGDGGAPAVAQGDTVWGLSEATDPDAARFAEWLLSDVGVRALDNFGSGFTAPLVAAEAAEEIAISGDLAAGEKAAMTHCGRCHVVNARNRMNAIGSTPSFGLMRNFSDWDVRFSTFWELKPHAAFTQIEGVTEPFPPERPSPIAPVVMTADDVGAIMAYVASIEPADLGAPIQSQ